MLETCECRTLAIGLCCRCQAPICLHHSRLLDGKCLCLGHYSEALNEKGPAADPALPLPDLARPDDAHRRSRRPWGRRR